MSVGETPKAMATKRWIRLLSPILALLALVGLAEAGGPTRIRVLSYNIHHGEGTDGKLDLDRLAAVIRSARPDLVALQEVDRGVRRSERLDEPSELARLTGLTAIFERNIPYQGGDYGNAVLSRLPVTGHRNHPLPSHYKGERRGALVVELTAPDADKTPIRLIATHLDYRPDDAERLESVQTIAAIVAEAPERPTLLAGDLNSLPESRTQAEFARTWRRANPEPLPTFPARRPTRQIDYVLYRPTVRWKVVEVRILDEPVASDHRPILVVLELVDAS